MLSGVKIISNGTIVEGIGPNQNIQLLRDYHGTTRTAQLSFDYGGMQHELNILLDGTDPFMFAEMDRIAIPFARVDYIMGNQNLLRITVTEVLLDGARHVITREILIENNAKGTYPIGPCPICGRSYSVYVDTKGNDQVRECYIVQFPAGSQNEIRITGIEAACSLGLKQQGEFVYPFEPALAGVQKSFYELNNSAEYEVLLTKPGFFDIQRLVNAGQSIHFGNAYFYQITVPSGLSGVKIISNGTIVEGAGSGQKIQLLRDFYGTTREAQMSFLYGGMMHNVVFLLDGTDPFDNIMLDRIAIPFARVDYIMGNQNLLRITVTEVFLDGARHVITREILIENNAMGTYRLDPCPICRKTYTVYVDTKWRDVIRECRII